MCNLYVRRLYDICEVPFGSLGRSCRILEENEVESSVGSDLCEDVGAGGVCRVAGCSDVGIG